MKYALRAILWIERAILSCGILLIAVLTITNVIGRAVFNNSLASTEELCQFLIVLVTFVGLSYAVSQGRHIRMTAIYDALGLRARKAVMVFICAFTAALLYYLTWKALDYVLVVRQLGSVSPTLQVPRYLIYLSAPLGLGLAALRYTFTLIRNLTEKEVYLSSSRKDEYVKTEEEAAL